MARSVVKQSQEHKIATLLSRIHLVFEHLAKLQKRQKNSDRTKI